ncbi:MAG: acyl-CoA thioesterase [Miltoncostaeaceae bacterium]
MSEPVSTAGPTERVAGFRFGMRCRVDLADTDLGAVVYYARYPLYLDRGVIEYRRHLGIPPLGPEGHLFVVASLSVDYRSSARFDDEVEVLVRVPEIRRSSHLVEARMERVDGEDATLLAAMRCTIVGVSTYEAGGRPSRVPEEMRAAVDGFEGR